MFTLHYPSPFPGCSHILLTLFKLYLFYFYHHSLTVAYLLDTNSNEEDAGRLQSSHLSMHQMPNYIPFRDKLPTSISYAYSNPFDFLTSSSAVSEGLLRTKASSFSELQIIQFYVPTVVGLHSAKPGPKVRVGKLSL